MDASQLFGTILRILNRPVFPLRARPGPMKPRRARASSGGSAACVQQEAGAPLFPSAATPVARSAIAHPAAAAAAKPAPTPAITQAMRTLEEVRADLARLRDQARRRQSANAQARRDSIGFAPTDFMDFGARPAAPRPAAPASAFAPTDFLDIQVVKPA